jgi:serine/threonine-protein kinase
MGEDEELGLYLVFEYAEGITLKERLVQGPLNGKASAALARQMGDALTTAHDAGVLHRDVKPENVILTASGGKIADFGIARVPNSTLTANGVLLGTPAYSAPETVADGSFSPQSDQFSMAATLYEAISQSRAFPGADAVTVAARIANEEPSPIALACGLSPHVDEVLRRGMHKNPNLRYESAREFGSALGEALEVLPRSQLATIPDGRHTLRGDELEQRAQRLGIGGLFLGALIGAGAMQLTSGLRHSESLDAAAPLEASVAPSPSVARGFLAEAPKPSPRPAASARANAARHERLERLDAGVPKAVVDAGTPAAPEAPDAGNDAP